MGGFKGQYIQECKKNYNVAIQVTQVISTANQFVALNVECLSFPCLISIVEFVVVLPLRCILDERDGVVDERVRVEIRGSIAWFALGI